MRRFDSGTRSSKRLGASRPKRWSRRTGRSDGLRRRPWRHDFPLRLPRNSTPPKSRAEQTSPLLPFEDLATMCSRNAKIVPPCESVSTARRTRSNRPVAVVLGHLPAPIRRGVESADWQSPGRNYEQQLSVIRRDLRVTNRVALLDSPAVREYGEPSWSRTVFHGVVRWPPKCRIATSPKARAVRHVQRGQCLPLHGGRTDSAVPLDELTRHSRRSRSLPTVNPPYPNSAR